MESHVKSNQKGDILVIDDIPENVRLLFEMLTGQGYEVRQTITGKQALQAIGYDPPDLILLDIMMPKMDGYQVCQHLKADPVTRDIPIIFLSAKDKPIDRVKAFKLGGADYISKPFYIEEVLARVEHQLILVRQRQQLEAKNTCLQQEIEERKKVEMALKKQQEFLHLAIDANPNLIYVKDEQGKFTLANCALAKLYDTTVENLVGKSEADFQSDRQQALQDAQGEIATKESSQINAALVTTNITTEPIFDRQTQAVRWFQTTKTAFASPDGKNCWILGVSVDITERQQAEAALWVQAERERLLRTIAQRIRQSLDVAEILQQTVREIQQFLQTDRVAICRQESDRTYRVVVESVSTPWPSLEGVTIADGWLLNIAAEWESKSKSLPHAIADATTKNIENIENNISSSLGNFLQQWQVRSQCIVPIFKNHLPQDSSSYGLWGAIVVHQCEAVREWQEGELEVLSSLATQVAIAVQQGELLAKLEVANCELKNLANLDGLTGLANRRRFDEVLNQEWQRMRRDRAPLSLILADIDFFKRYNDTYGHQKGDECLKAVAKAIRSGSQRSSDLAARYGGEEFAVILPNTSLEGAVKIARRIQEQVRALRIDRSPLSTFPYLTISSGVASQFPHKQETLENLIGTADAALYRAKASGRDRVES
ncbi:diguanylate cyclase [Spirulina sp. 06S082]|uniref:GGDEF domain-containing response regulator n=1 Tax=Spirulina sp. 06S082 TaxID=3110248 RepID=UPI002B20AF66|nr:diguanylate cyclase [Spirulina sp. 06S082]MEA5471747.1 diguanylate cyclase [Spirulina sp. 06S082]